MKRNTLLFCYVAMLDFSQPVPIDIPYDYRPPVQGPKSYTRPVMTISKGDGPQAMPNVIGNLVCPQIFWCVPAMG